MKLDLHSLPLVYRSALLRLDFPQKDALAALSRSALVVADLFPSRPVVVYYGDALPNVDSIADKRALHLVVMDSEAKPSKYARGVCPSCFSIVADGRSCQSCADKYGSQPAIPAAPAPSVESVQPAIVSVSDIFGTAPGSVDVSLEDGQRVRVALQWDHVDIESSTLSDAAHEYIASEVRRKLRFTAEPAKSPASTTEAVHTATPGNLPFVLRYVNPYLAVIDGAQRGHEGLVRIQAYSDTLSQKEKELANFIVTACNSHAALLAKIQALESHNQSLRRKGAKALDVLARLHDGLSDMIEGGRLSEDVIPDDYQWLVSMLTNESLPLFPEGTRGNGPPVPAPVAVGAPDVVGEHLGDIKMTHLPAAPEIAAYNVWICIEAVDAEGDAVGDDIDPGFGSCATFDNLDKATAFARDVFAYSQGSVVVASPELLGRLNDMREPRGETPTALIVRVCQKVCDETESWSENDIGRDLAYLAWAIAEGQGKGFVEWDESNAIYNRFREWFHCTDPVWLFIKHAQGE